METQVITEKQRLARLDFIGIEDGHKAALTEVWPLLEGKLDGILDKFYAHLSAYPALQGHLGGDGKIDYLKKAQQAHWQLLFGGKFGEDYFGRAVAIGNAHQRIGLEPRWYVAGYAIVLGDLISIVRGAGKRKNIDLMCEAVIRAVMLDMELAISVYIEAGDKLLREELQGLAATLDAEVRGAVDNIVQQTGALDTSSAEMTGATGRVETASASVAGASEEATTSVETIAAATEELSTSVQEVARQMESTNAAITEVTGEAQQIAGVVSGLNEEVQRIGSIVDLIRDVADQTNLLALNATIEAARAGEAGKGFAVVAGEVKALAAQTGKATQDIADQVARVQTQTGNAVSGIERIGDTVNRLQAIAAEVDAVLKDQGKATTEIAENVQQTASGTREVSGRISEVATEMSRLQEMANGLRGVADGLNGATSNLQEKVAQTIHSLRNHEGMSRRDEPRVTPQPPLASRIDCASGAIDTELFDLNETGCRVARGKGLATATDIVVHIPGLPVPQPAIAERVDDDAVFLKFRGDETARTALRGYLGTKLGGQTAAA
jgi:methyl-accepting chemotaxis protein